MSESAKVEMSHCAIHDADEPMTPGGIFCGECWHVYQTPADLVGEWNETQRRMAEETRDPLRRAILLDRQLRPDLLWSVNAIPFCPLCLHDFVLGGTIPGGQ